MVCVNEDFHEFIQLIYFQFQVVLGIKFFIG